MKHVEKVCQGRADRNKDFRVEWRFCAHAENIHQLPDMIRLARSIGVDTIQVMNLTPYVSDQKFKNLFYHRSLANKCFAEARRVAEELNFAINIPPVFDLGTWDSHVVQIRSFLKGPVVQTRQIEMVTCFYPWQTCSVNEQGNVKPCCIYWKSMGNLNSSPFDAIWNGRKYRKLRATVNTKPDSICHDCRMPRFDSDNNMSASQLVPGIREMVQNALTIRREKITFAGTMNEEFDPRNEPSGKAAVGTEPLATQSVQS